MQVKGKKKRSALTGYIKANVNSRSTESKQASKRNLLLKTFLLLSRRGAPDEKARTKAGNIDLIDIQILLI